MAEFPAPPSLPQPAYAQASGPSGPRAGFWSRLAAALLDGILLGVVNVLLDIGVGRAGSLLALALGIRVIDFSTGGPIGFGRAVIRYFGRIVSTIPIFLGYFWMLWDKERQTWHDKFANDVVVPVSSYPVAHWPN